MWGGGGAHYAQQSTQLLRQRWRLDYYSGIGNPPREHQNILFLLCFPESCLDGWLKLNWNLIKMTLSVSILKTTTSSKDPYLCGTQNTQYCQYWNQPIESGTDSQLHSVTGEALPHFYIWLDLHGCDPYGGIVWHEVHYIPERSSSNEI